MRHYVGFSQIGSQIVITYDKVLNCDKVMKQWPSFLPEWSRIVLPVVSHFLSHDLSYAIQTGIGVYIF